MNEIPIHLLLVEDNSADAVLLNKEFRESAFGPFVITHVQRLSQALQRMEDQKYDAVLLDLGLPDSQGLETLGHLQHQMPRDIPIVVVTGLEDEGLRISAMKAGADDYLVKGVLTDSIHARSVRYAIERKRAHEAAKETERRLSLAVEAAQMGMFNWDIRNNQLTWLHLHPGLFGGTPEEFAGNYSAVVQRVNPDDLEEMKARARQCIASGEDFWHEFRVTWPDGTEHWLDARARVTLSENGEPAQMLGAVVNITARKAAEIAAKQREAELAHLARVVTMGQMASGLAHELTQPLGAILNYAGACMVQLEGRSEIPPGIAASIGEVITETRRAGAICSRMRLFVRKQLPNCVALDINKLVADSVKMMEWELRTRKIQAQMELSEPLPMVCGDSVQIQQVLVNLILNGAEAMTGKTPAKLRVSTAISGDARKVEICVTDSGKGMTPENYNRLFEPFFTTKPNGLGMGLSICRSLVEDMGGRLLASMNTDQGMRFCFTIPIDATAG
jgi:PAS domain S-box-containing protein